MIPRLDGISRDAELLDALAAGRAVDDPTVSLLCALREATDRPRAAATAVSLRRRLGRRSAILLSVTLLSSSIGVAAAATSHPGDLLYPVHRVVLGRTADDPTRTEQLVTQVESIVGTAPGGAAMDPVRRTDAISLLDQAQGRIPDLHVRDAQPLEHRVLELRALTSLPAPTPRTRHHPRHVTPVRAPAKHKHLHHPAHR